MVLFAVLSRNELVEGKVWGRRSTVLRKDDEGRSHSFEHLGSNDKRGQTVFTVHASPNCFF